MSLHTANNSSCYTSNRRATEASWEAVDARDELNEFVDEFDPNFHMPSPYDENGELDRHVVQQLLDMVRQGVNRTNMTEDERDIAMSPTAVYLARTSDEISEMYEEAVLLDHESGGSTYDERYF